MDCGCKIVDRDINGKGIQFAREIKYCPKHAAVDELLVACKSYMSDWDSQMHYFDRLSNHHILISKAIAKAEGRKE